ncbi:MAG: MipA/OmpV family protein [Alphaproteobacteria bacterium]
MARREKVWSQERKSVLWSVIMIVIGGISTSAQARNDIPLSFVATASDPATAPAITGKDWRFVLGGGIGYGPVYEGSSTYAPTALPAFEINWRDRVIFDYQGLHGNLLKDKHLTMGFDLGYDLGRQESDDYDHLRGYGDIEPAVTMGMHFSYGFDYLKVDASFTQAVSDNSNANVTAVGVSSGMRFKTRTLIVARFGTEFANESYMDKFFRIDAAASARTGQPEYNPEYGIKDGTIDLSIIQPIGDHWALTGLAQYKRMVGPAAESPIVADPNQFFGGVTLGYTF